jgi:hypothetical protein
MNEASTDELFRELRALLARGKLRLELDLARLDHIDSPVAVEADSNIWVYGAIAVCAAAFWQGGTYPGIAAIAISLALYFTVARRYVRRRLVRWWRRALVAPRTAASRRRAIGWRWSVASRAPSEAGLSGVAAQLSPSTWRPVPACVFRTAARSRQP